MAATSMISRLLLLALSFLIAPAYSWGDLGHRTVGYVAEKFLTSQGAAFLSNLINNEDISEAALWADELKFAHCSGWQYTKPWHFIDAQDDPPRQCGVQFDRDCVPDEGCVVSAIINQTSRVNDQSLSAAQQSYAIRFLLHFIGDIHQPLHTEAELKGGNGIEVQFGGEHHENLHSVWDTAILEKHVGTGKDNEIQDAKNWADSLVGSAGGPLHAAAECADLAHAEDCALLWAGEANKYVCSYVLKDDVQGVQGVDLSGDYYEGAVPIVDELILKAGRRLGAWVNALAVQNGVLGLVRQEEESLKHQLKRRSGHPKHPKKNPFSCPDPYA